MVILDPDSLFMFLVGVLALYRLVRLIVVDDGPFDVFYSLRVALGAYDKDKSGRPRSTLGRGIRCPHCTGFWLAHPFAMLLALLILPHGLNNAVITACVILLWLALAGAQSLLFSLWMKS